MSGRPQTDAVTAVVRPLRGIAFGVSAIALLSVVDVLAKILVASHSVAEVIFFRSLVALPLVVLVAHRHGGLAALRPKRTRLQALRAGAGVIAVTFFFLGLRHLPLAEATAILFAAPLFMTLLSVPLLGETVGPHRLGAVFFGFIGVLVVTRPGTGAASLAALLPLAAALAYALSMIVTRRLTRSETNISMIFIMTVAMLVLSGLVLPLAWAPPAPADLALMAALGVISTAAHLALVEAYRNAPVAVVAPFDYTAMFWAVVFGYLFWDELPGLVVWGGIAIIVASGLYVLFREARAHVQAARDGIHP